MATTPLFTLSYWRPWKKDSNFINSWLDYNRDVSLQKYNAEIISEVVGKTSSEQIDAINQLGHHLTGGLEIISKHLNVTNNRLDTLIQIQISNQLVLEEISELLRIPDSEKSRLFHIKKAVKFLRNIEKDDSFFSDALSEFQKSEALNNSDFFTLFNIGMIQLYDINNIDIESAKNHFLSSAKYSQLLDDDELEIIYDDSFYNEMDQLLESISGYCYKQASICCYIIGDDQKALEYIEKAKVLGLSSSFFYIGKYASRLNLNGLCIKNIEIALSNDPSIYEKIMCDYDYLLNKDVVDYLKKYVEEIEHKFNVLELTHKQYLKEGVFEVEKFIDKAIVVNTYLGESELVVKSHIERYNQLIDDIEKLENEITNTKQLSDELDEKREREYLILSAAIEKEVYYKFKLGFWSLETVIFFIFLSVVLTFIFFSMDLSRNLGSLFLVTTFLTFLITIVWVQISQSMTEDDLRREKNNASELREKTVNEFYRMKERNETANEEIVIKEEELEDLLEKIRSLKIRVD